ncbi:MAG: response regulator [Proteobacteria bacterium]|nr:response regulator [Pseudomonadota bacterium]MBU1709996.1 response regulator [Pseudomonadota bacterium]
MSITASESILIVDDEQQLCDLLSRLLEKESYSCRTVNSGNDAQALLAEDDFALILLDVEMPEMNGLQLQEIIRDKYPDIAIIMVSGVDDREIIFQALKNGAYGYIIKPIEQMEVIINVKNALRLRKLEIENREYQIELERLVDERTFELRKAYKELQSSQEQLIQQEKLATIGHLAAGVAHEIKNPTGYIGSNLGTMNKYLDKFSEFIEMQDQTVQDLPAEKITELRQARKKLKIDFAMEDARDIISECLEGVERIKKIVEGLKSFCRKEQDTSRPVNINDCMENALTVAWNELKYKATVEKNYGDLPQVECFPNQLGQVFMNLLVNAAHAIKDQGTITITTRKDGDAVLVSITDTGCGMPKSIQEKIFEPFFTTKEDGVGTGLGLSIIKEIVAKHNGEIFLESEEGKGSTFTLRIPCQQ